MLMHSWLYLVTRTSKMGDTPLNTELEDDLESLLSCPICMDDYRDPRMLPCQHSFCENCLTKYIKDSAKVNNDTGIKLFRCPICRCKTKQRNDQDLESGFPMNRTIHELLESKEKMVEEDGLSSDATDDNDDKVVNKRDNEGMARNGTFQEEQPTSRYKPKQRLKRRRTRAARRQNEKCKHRSPVAVKRKENQKKKNEHQQALETQNTLEQFVIDMIPASIGDVVLNYIVTPLYVKQLNYASCAMPWMFILLIFFLFILYMYFLPYSTSFLSTIYIAITFESARKIVNERVHAVCEDCSISKYVVFVYLLGRMVLELILVILSISSYVIFAALFKTMLISVGNGSLSVSLGVLKRYFDTFTDIYISCPAITLETFCQDFVLLILSL